MSHFEMERSWTDLPVVVVDFETTGPDPQTCLPVEVAAVRFEAGRAVAEWSTLLNPGAPIPEAATAIHGITDAMVAEAPQLELATPELFNIAQGAIPCAYNAPFDRTILHRYVKGADCALFDAAFPWIDVLVMIRNVEESIAGAGRHRLAAVCKRWGVKLRGAHRALGDVRATGELLYRLLDHGKVKACPLGALLEHTTECRAEQEADFQRWLRQQERPAWRQYACAALAIDPELPCTAAAEVADKMLDLERQRFNGGA